MVKKLRCSWRSFVVAALLSALASTLIVAVGPGFSSPNDNAAEQAKDAAAEGGPSQVASTGSTDDGVTTTTVVAPTPTQEPHNPDVINPNASSVPDTHGHVGSGTGTSTGSQADPGHKDEGFKPDDNKSNGSGTGDTDAASCTNKHQGPDAPQGGANENPGPYDNTCDGDNSENGQGSAAPGKGTPCAGCVGNADDKNPPGQVKEFNGQKPNDMGYECDGNQGVGAHYGRGNPAHTGDCGSGSTPPPTETEVVCRFNTTTSEWEIVEIPKGTSTQSDKPANAPECRNEPPPPPPDDSLWVCRQVGNDWQVREIKPNQLRDGDKIVAEGTNPASCATAPPPPPPDSNVWVCRQTNGQWSVVPVTLNELKDGDRIVAEGTNPMTCVIAPPTCPVDMNPFIDGVQCIPPPTCPDDSDMPGQPAPDGDRDNCYTSEPPVVCPADSDMPGEPVPGGDVDNCYEPPRLCPRGSDFPGQPMPGGDIRNCYVDTPLPDRKCPRGTDHAGQPIPGGDIRRCNDDVLGDVIEKDKPGGDVLGTRDGAAERPATRGRILPFTGASLLAYLVLALELLGAGALILRARKR
ncbi:MAG: hypothetical protein ACRDKT_02115 [Actinomycetota bacterium]